MCGINGILYKDRQRQVDPALIDSMNKALLHRGPDEGGAHIDGSLGFGHRRLSIVDVASGQQPMCNEDGTVWITFNGEIYNYAALREELFEKGHLFRTSSDTEVIVHLYEEDGEECVSKLRGMFAFAIWDSRRRSLFIARDRLGIKPLYYTVREDLFAFSSEVRGLLQVPGVQARLNLPALHDYLTFRYPVAPETMFDGIFKLPAGHSISLKDGRCDIRAYWDLRYSEKLVMNEADYIAEFRRQLVNATMSHLIGEVPLGILLSGGLDSTVIASIVSEHVTKQSKTFSVAFENEGDDFDERRFARLAARRYNTDHHEIAISQNDFVGALTDYVGSMEEPMADPASIPLYHVARLAREHVTVVLSGEGSDELFAGYGLNFKGIRRARWIRRIPAAVRNGLLRPLNDRFVGSARVGRQLDIANLPLSHFPQKSPTYMGRVFSEEAKVALYGDVMKNTARRNSEQVVIDLYARTLDYDYVDQMLYVYTKHWLADDLLLKADKMTMAHSLELRVPFLDHALVEFAARLPVEMKIRDRGRKGVIAKYILRKAFADRVPAEILDRPKIGFAVPLKSLFKGRLGEIAMDVFHSPEMRESGLFDNARIGELVARGRTGEGNPDQLWILLVFAMWLRLFKVTL